MADFTEKQLRNIGEAVLTGDVPTNAAQSEDNKARVAEIRRLQREREASDG